MNTELQNTKEAFDKAAAKYDAIDNANPILQWMRKIVHRVYFDRIQKGSNILELNAGTGVDAVFLRENYMRVTATDISGEMVELINKKAEARGFDIATHTLGFDEIGEIQENDFDAVVSNFGGLNCINDFTTLKAALHSKLKPDGKFIAVVMNKYCPWEMFYYIVTLRFAQAFRRLKKEGIMADLNGEKVKTYYYSPAEFAAYFEPDFTAEKFYTLALNTPPPYLVGIYNKFRPLVKIWMTLDELFKGVYPFNRFGDHFIIVMNRK